MMTYRSWGRETIDGYTSDIKGFESFLMDLGKEPSLKNGESISVVDRWIKYQKENSAYNTTTRRVNALSSLYSFYQNLGIVKSNVFKAAQVPGRKSEEGFSRTMDLDDLKEVYTAIHDLKRKGVNVEIPVKILLFTGLRNHALSNIKVKDINWMDGLIVFTVDDENSKKKNQVFPLPPIFLTRLKEYVDENSLDLHDPLCYGIKGLPLKNKQLNRSTDAVCHYLHWIGKQKVTPHGFRYSIATLLDEKGLSRQSIQFLLGHSDTETIKYYLRANKMKIHHLRKALTEIEEELEEHLRNMNDQHSLQEPSPNQTDPVASDQIKKSEGTNQATLPHSEEFLLALSEVNPMLFEKLMMKHYLPTTKKA